MSRCTHHPGREAVLTIHQRGYCEPCQRGIEAARAAVDRHVEPKDCFVWYVGANDWRPITGTGCAHWVAHQLGIRSRGGEEGCLKGYIYRVTTLVHRTSAISLDQVQINDVYISPHVDHTGLVISVRRTPTRPGQPPVPPTIMIRHDSSRQGGVADNDFASHFHSRGTFRRL